MERLRITPRKNYAQILEANGLSFHAADNYWKEDACYRFTLKQVEEIEAATAELHEMCVGAMQHIVSHQELGRLGIPAPFWRSIAESATNLDFSLYGRFDFAYDGKGPPKLLEYNADTPTSLLESAVCQWFWLQDCYPDLDQFNSLHERLIEKWRSLPGEAPIHLAYLADNEEDWVCITYLMDTLVQAGRTALHIPIEQIGWDSAQRAFVDVQGDKIETLFKLYPWEWLMRDEFGQHIPTSSTQFIEPIWKAVLSCKGLLPYLWERYPDHPNLLPAYFEPGRLVSYARKPLYSREGANVELVREGQVLVKGKGPYGAEGYVYQALCELPNVDGAYPVIGSWLVDGQPAGMCIREDASPVTTNMSHFVPHYISG